jgi:GTP-binding protein HflX
MLSKSDVFAENKLFATLDTTIRKVVVKNLPFLLTDTVGFIRKLPHHLVESFKSTLDEVNDADVLVHVVDISHTNFEDHIRVVNETLKDIGALDKPTVVVFNKVDAFTYVKQDEDDLLPKTRENYSLEDLKKMWMSKSEHPTVYISAVKKINVDEMREVLYETIKSMHLQIYPNQLLY